MNDHDSAPHLVRWCVANIKPRTRGKPAEWNDAWVRGTIRFGWQVCFVGLGVLVFCAFLPGDDRRWFVATFGLVTSAIGFWHTRNARSICDLAIRQGKTP